MDDICIAIVEDEPLFIRQLQEYIDRYEKERLILHGVSLDTMCSMMPAEL